MGGGAGERTIQLQAHVPAQLEPRSTSAVQCTRGSAPPRLKDTSLSLIRYVQNLKCLESCSRELSAECRDPMVMAACDQGSWKGQRWACDSNIWIPSALLRITTSIVNRTRAVFFPPTRPLTVLWGARGWGFRPRRQVVGGHTGTGASGGQ